VAGFGGHESCTEGVTANATLFVAARSAIVHSMDAKPSPGPRARAAEIVFGHDTFAGRAFDVALIVAILASVAVVMVETVAGIRATHGVSLRRLEWAFTILFTAEYALRLWCAPRRTRYARSFFGVVDLLSILPTYVSAFVPGGHALLTVRSVRLLRIFRVLKLGQYVSEASHITRALRQSRRKITVFLAAILTLVVILGSLMYVVESAEAGFTSIPRSVYWAIVTLTTVGYGDIAPRTPLGQGLASFIMILGYGIIAVPTGIVTVELGNVARRDAAGASCPSCFLDEHESDARYCRRCGGPVERAAIRASAPGL
jgi:voltage-gated potassium channel